VLKALLDCLVNINLAFLRRYPKTLGLYQSGVTYGRTLWWEPIPALYSRTKGDCKSLATALVAQYQMQGIPSQPVFRWMKNSKDNTDFHILVQTPSGFEDPSKILGMDKNTVKLYYAEDGSVISYDSYGMREL
jgi:hypothetical protein